MSTTPATGEGLAMSMGRGSKGRDRMLSTSRAHRELPVRELPIQVQVDVVKGGDARGIPPRGRPV